MRRKLGLTTAILLATPLTASAQTPGDPSDGEERIDLQELIAEVIEANPDLAAFEAEAEGRLAAGRAAAAFPDPMVGIGFNDVGTAFSRRENMMSMRELMVRQTFPWPGKRALRQEIQEILADAARRGGEARALALAEAATNAYADLWLAFESRRLRDRQRETLSEVLEQARVRFEALDATLSDPLRAELALARIDEPLAELDEREAEARAVLAALVARPGDPMLGEPALPPARPLPSELDELLQAVEEHPALAELAVREESLRAAARLAEREVFPDIQVGLGYGQRDAGPDMIGVEVMVPLPLFGKGRRADEAEAARADARTFEQRRRARRDELIRDVRAAQASALRDESVVALYADEILPIARDNVSAANVAYEAARVDFLTLLDAQLQVYEQELNLLRARASRIRSQARLERALGVPPATPSARRARGLGDETSEPGISHNSTTQE